MHRRLAVKLIAGGSASLISGLGGAASAVAIDTTYPRSIPFALTSAQDAFLDDLERRGCLFFLEQAGAASGQVLDRASASNNTGARDLRTIASIAATGFGLTALCIADKRGFLPVGVPVERVRKTLRFHADQLPNEHGFFSHFNHVDTGAPAWDGEISSIDTCLFLCGVLTARAHFSADAEIVRLATLIYERVDWPWFQAGGLNFSMGWHKATGFLKARWDHFSELMMLPLLALGSTSHPVRPAAWTSWTRPRMSYGGLTYISGDDPLFVHQYSHAWFDFRNRRDAYADYFENSILATRAHKSFCLNRGRPYSPDYWGITASDSAAGYQAWGGPPALGHIDGSVVPCASAGSLPFLPSDCLRVLMALKTSYKDAWGRYGFCDAFHPGAGWYDPDVLGIDLGISVLMAENLRSEFVWQTFARNPEIPRAMNMAGFRSSKHAAT